RVGEGGRRRSREDEALRLIPVLVGVPVAAVVIQLGAVLRRAVQCAHADLARAQRLVRIFAQHRRPRRHRHQLARHRPPPGPAFWAPQRKRATCYTRRMSGLPAIEQFWEAYLRSLPEPGGERRYHEAFAFDGTPELSDALARLVLSGRKTATSMLLWELEARG